jgi:hypothetical protein
VYNRVAQEGIVPQDGGVAAAARQCEGAAGVLRC